LPPFSCHITIFAIWRYFENVTVISPPNCGGRGFERGSKSKGVWVKKKWAIRQPKQTRCIKQKGVDKKNIGLRDENKNGWCESIKRVRYMSTMVKLNEKKKI